MLGRVLLCVALFSIGSRSLLAETAPAAAKGAGAAKVTRVENVKKVCMVNDQLFDKDQVPVEIEGKTYYGCCEMCKQALKAKAALRSAVDPVTGKPVDKAKAVIGAQADGKVLYFENETNFKKFASEGERQGEQDKPRQ
jgi:YHS domain-containing protein